MTKTNLNELLSVLEEIRTTEYPDIPKKVIEDIVKLQYENQDSRSEARTKTVTAIASYLNEATVKK